MQHAGHKVAGVSIRPPFPADILRGHGAVVVHNDLVDVEDRQRARDLPHEVRAQLAALRVGDNAPGQRH